jgi:hypothetical protein
MRRVVCLVVSVIIVGILSPPSRFVSAQTADIDDTWFFEQPETDGWHGIKFADRANMMDTFSYLKRTETFHGKPCESTAEGRCADSAAQEFSAILPVCASNSDVNCVAKLSVVNESGDQTDAVFSRSVPSKGPSEFAAEPTVDLPAGRSGQLWELPSAAHAAGNQYYTRVRVTGTRDAIGKFEHNSLDVGLFAAKASEVACSNPCVNRLALNRSMGSWELNGPGNGAQWNKTCVAVSESNGATATCLERKAFPSDRRFSVTVRLSQSPSGWLHGRLSSPSVSLSSSKGVVTVEISGKSVSVPVIATGMDWSLLPESLKAVYAGGLWPGSRAEGGSSTSRQEVPKLDRPVANILYLPSSSGKAVIEELQAWLPVVNDQASANVSTWGMRSLSAAEMSGASECIKSEPGVAGIVTTNATAYSAGPPKFVEKTGTLDYKVAGPHLSSGGGIFSGDYNLLMKSSVARCIYGFTSDPVSMSLSVVDTGGESQAVETAVSESDGWMKLSASGFTHSSPTIRAKLTQVSSTVAGASRVKVGRSITANALASSAKLPITKKSRATLSVPKSNAKVCAVRGAALIGRAKGTCRVTVSVVTGGKQKSKTLSIKIV